MNLPFPSPVSYSFERPVGEFKIDCLNETVAEYLGDTPDRTAEYLIRNVPRSPRFSNQKESFVVVFLDTSRKIIGYEIIGMGILDSVLVHPREVFRPAIVIGAHSIVIAHNHPTGDCTPSTADIRVTRDLIRAGQMLKIEVLDHIIFNTVNKTHSSLKSLGVFHA